jgi:hypothetical protein
MMKPFAIAVVLVALMSGPALAQTPAPEGTPTRVRATVEKLEGQNLTVKSRDGQNVTIVLAPNTTVVTLVKKSIADIKAGDYVASTGVKGPDGKLHAVEVRIFPEEMRGGNEGQRPWDLMPDSLMTNATVGKIEQAPNGPVLHVTYKGGQSEYTVGPDVPVLAIGPGDMSLLKPGAAVFIGALKKPDGTLTASRITAEKDGVKPPM